MKLSSFSKIFFIPAFIMLITTLSITFSYHGKVMNIYFYLAPYLSLNYTKDKELISPYFDKEFYEKEYANELKESGQEPIDHFLTRSGSFFGGDFDPNSWFNVTLYKERLWPCSGNAFVDFLKQPQLSVNDDAKTVEVFANDEQLFRAWMAVEGFMRLNKFKVTLILPESLKSKVPVCFDPISKRGLTIQFSSDPKLSFYKSPFIKSPQTYETTDLPAVEKGSLEDAVTHIKQKTGYNYLMHRLYNYTHWKKKGRINPCMLNFAHYCLEPIEFSNFGNSEYEFKKSMQRLAPGFDLMFINSDIGTKNLRIIPGYVFTHIDHPEEIPTAKQYEISFLLSLGGKGIDSFKSRGSFIYNYRKIIWNNEKKFALLTKFYISKRDLQRYPKDMHDRVLPTDSKKWIFGSQFTIAIENVKQENYFSEKLIDCFMALSVPIYIGCPNIKDYFDQRGMFIAKDPEEVLRIAQSLTPETYAKMLPYVIENKKRAQMWMQLEKTFIDEFYQKEISLTNEHTAANE